MTSYSGDRLIILDADGTTVDAFDAMGRTFAYHGMDLGDLERFQKRRHLFKYLGGVKEFPTNLRRQLGKRKRRQLIDTLTEVYRREAALYPGVAALLQELIAAPGLRVGLVTRNITREPDETLRELFRRHGVELARLDFLVHLPLAEEKVGYFRAARESYAVNPARAYACGDEHRDYLAAVGAGLHPFIAAYGFEDYARLTGKFGIPGEVVSRTPAELAERVRHALDLPLEPSAKPEE